VSGTDTTPTLIIILNCVVFLNYYLCRRVSIRVVSGIRVCVRAKSRVILTIENNGFSEFLCMKLIFGIFQLL
jgi:hypothetical protein